MTLREYLDGLPEDSIKWIKEHCKFIDVESKDGYRHMEPVSDIIEQRLADNSYNRNISEEEVIINTLLLRDKNGNYVYNDSNMSTDDRNELVYKIIYDRHGSNSLDYRVTYYLPLGYIRLMAKEEIHRYQADAEPENRDKLRLKHLLLFTDDFSNIDWSKLTTENWINVDKGILGILPKDVIKQYLLQQPRAIKVNEIPMNCDVFDELFFGEDGWTEDQKREVLREFDDSPSGVANFMERIVAVDKKYLRYIYKLITRNGRTLSNELYCLQKPADEQTKCAKKYKYRYSDEYRKLFWIARCCYLGYTNKTAVSKMKDAGSLLKLYGYNFDNIFDMLYPEYATQQPTVEE